MTKSTKPRVAIIHYSAPSTMGQVENMIASHARFLADHGCPVKIISGRGESFDPRVPVQTIPIVDPRHSFVVEVNQKLAQGLIPARWYPLTAALSHALESALVDVEICIAHDLLTMHKNLALTSVLADFVGKSPLRLIAWAHDLAWQNPLYIDELHSGHPWDLMRQPWKGVQYVVGSEAQRKALADLFGATEADITVVPDEDEPVGLFGLDESARISNSSSEIKLPIPSR